MKNLIRMIFFVSILVLAYYLLKPSIPERTLIGQVEKIEDKEPVGKTPNQETIEAKIKTSELDKKTPPLTEKVPATEAFSNTETGKKPLQASRLNENS
jgi:hypothetical protein